MSMSIKSCGAALMVAGALFALTGCETPARETADVDTLQSQISDLEARVTAAEAAAAESASAADQCSHVCTRAESMFQQSTRK
jgi:hypothetical protein